MPLGDSITGAPGCWRALLWNRLQSAGHTNIDFVGTLPAPQGCGVPYDGDNEGHGGSLVTDIANQNQLPGWLAATHPDIVLMHFGTNDVWSNRRRRRDPRRVQQAGRPDAGQQPGDEDPGRADHPDERRASCAECPARVAALNNAIPGWAAGKTTAQSPITVVDQWTGFDTAADTGDGVHPNDSGYQKISDRWYPGADRGAQRHHAADHSSVRRRPPRRPPTPPRLRRP